MCAAGLKLNEPKYSFGFKDITYLGYLITQEVIKTDPNKVHGIMYVGLPTTTTEARALIGMVQYYRYVWPRQYHIISPLTKEYIGPKGRKIFWHDALEDSFKGLKCMVSAENFLSYPYWKILFTVPTNASIKYLGVFISQNNKPITLF